MNNKKATKRALLTSVMALVMCVVMLVGTTFAWFTDTASTGVNKIVAGNLKVDIVDATDTSKSLTAQGEKLNFISAGEGDEVKKGEAILWEPNCTYLTEGFQIKNGGNLALKWKVEINKDRVTNSVVGSEVTPSKSLLEVIDFSIVDASGNTVDIDNFTGHIRPADGSDANTGLSGVYKIKAHMDANAGNDYQNLTLDGISITVYATQDTVENDSFDDQYDKYATYAPSNRRYVVTSHEEAKSAFAAGGSISFDHYFEGDETKTKASDRLVIQYPSVIELNEAIHVPGSLEDSANWAEFFINADTTINASSRGGVFCSDKVGETNPDYIGGPYVAHVNGENIVVTVNGGFYHGGGTTLNVEKGTLIVNGGFFQVTPDIDTNDCRYTLNCIDANYKNGTANIIVKGGIFVNFDPSNNLAEGENTNFVAPGYKVISETQTNGDVYYTVVAE